MTAKLGDPAPRRMREGQCRTTRKGAKYCKRGGKIRFVKK